MFLISENHYGMDDPLAPTTDSAIAARRDLDPVAPRTDGAIDAKIVRRLHPVFIKDESLSLSQL